MGIKNLLKLLKERNPHIIKNAKMNHFVGKKFAVDISIFINKYVNSSRDQWINQMTYLLMSLRYNDLKVIIVFDGKHVPEEKTMERENRKTAKQALNNRCDRIEALYEKVMALYFENDQCSTRLVNPIIQSEFDQLFLRSKIDKDINKEDPEEIVIVLRERLEKARLNAEGVSRVHKDITRELVKAMGFSYIEAYGEAEALCSSLAYHNIVDGVISTDSDCFVYGCPLLIKDIKAGVWEYLTLNDVLYTLDLKMSSFIDLCIALGCDYNKNMPKIGMKRAYDNIIKYGSLDKWEEAEPDKKFEILRYSRCREIFRPYSRSYVEKCKIRLPKDVNVDKLNDIFKRTDSMYSGDYVKSVQNKEAKPMLFSKPTNYLPDEE